jgi:hypothetical protein
MPMMDTSVPLSKTLNSLDTQTLVSDMSPSSKLSETFDSVEQSITESDYNPKVSENGVPTSKRPRVKPCPTVFAQMGLDQTEQIAASLDIGEIKLGIIDTSGYH